MIQLLIPLSIILAFVAGASLAWGAWPDQSKQAIRERLQKEVGQSKDNILLRQVSGALAPVHRRLPITGYIDWLRGKMDAAGVHMPVSHMLAVQELAMVVAVLVYYILNPDKLNLGAMLMLSGGATVLPVFWLNSRIRSRKETVARDLPEVVDLLALCVGAGADFMTALARIVREFRLCPVREELAIVLSEVRVGKRRRDALRAFAQRMQTPESSTFARTLIQADRMGTGLIEALNVLSEDMRMARYHWAERYAQKAPLKMLVPLVLSLGSAMVVIAGPILIQFMRGGLMGLSGGLSPAQVQQHR